MTTEEYDTYLKTKIRISNTVPIEIPVRETIGKSLLGLMCPNPPYAKDDDSIPLLKWYARDGYPVDCGDDWTQEYIELMLQYGPHRSALEKKAVRQLCQETADKITHKYARMVKWGDIKTNIPTKLKISPVAMIPHKSKPYMCILDISVTLFNKGVKCASVNEKTTKMARPEAMAQLGFVLKRIIHTMAQYRHHGLHIKFT